jgi:dihydroneopterin aldolase
VADIVSIRDLRVQAVIGAYDWEREIEQTLVVSVDMGVDVSPAASSDSLADAPVDYAAAASAIGTVLREGRFQLIETAAARVAGHLLAAFGLGWVRVEVAKPRPGEGFTAAVTVERTA